jgi:hypothetical protein
MRRKFLHFAFCILTCAVLATGCAKARAEAVPDGPPLAMPLPPPRVLAPVDEPLASAPAGPDVPAVAVTQPAARPPVRRAAAANTEPEIKPEPVAPQVPAPVASAEPPRELRPASSPVEDAVAEREVRDLLTRAARDLNRTDYRKLTAEGRLQYEQSKRFSDQAEQALKERNFVYASTLADKAATLAAVLVGG